MLAQRPPLRAGALLGTDAIPSGAFLVLASPAVIALACVARSRQDNSHVRRWRCVERKPKCQRPHIQHCNSWEQAAVARHGKVKHSSLALTCIAAGQAPMWAASVCSTAAERLSRGVKLVHHMQLWPSCGVGRRSYQATRADTVSAVEEPLSALKDNCLVPLAYKLPRPWPCVNW